MRLTLKSSFRTQCIGLVQGISLTAKKLNQLFFTLSKSNSGFALTEGFSVNISLLDSYDLRNSSK